jgi:hypothetical protein
MDIGECLEKGFIRKIKPDPRLVEKEFKEANYDLERAEHALEDENFKWCIVKSYYSMYHAAKALLLLKRIHPKKHAGVISMFGLHYVTEGYIEEAYGRALTKGMEFRGNRSQ